MTNNDKIIHQSGKLFNFRPVCFFALFVGLTVVVCMMSVNIGIWFVFLWIGLLVAFFASFNFWHRRTNGRQDVAPTIMSKDSTPKNQTFLAVGAASCRPQNANSSSTLHHLSTSRTFFVITIILCLCVIISFGVTTIVFENQRSFIGVGELTGTITSFTIREDTFAEEGRASIVLTNATFIQVRNMGTIPETNRTNITGRVRINLFDQDEETLTALSHYGFGTIISLRTTITATSATPFNVNNRIRYSTNFRGDGLDFAGQSSNVRFVVLRHSYDYFNRHMDERSAALMYSMLFGDRTSLDPDTRTAFSQTGLAHVLSVSGLHVGLIIGLLVGLMNLARLPKKPQFFVALGFLLFYMFLADFRYAIIRASIMFLVILFNRMFVRRVDLMSSMCMAMVITLILFPYSIMSVSFQMTFACVIGIALVYRPIYNFCHKHLSFGKYKFKHNGIMHKFYKGIHATIALDLSTTIGIFPLLVLYFGTYPLIGLLTNLLLLPLIVIAFKFSIIALITYVGFPLLFIADWLTRGVIYITSWLGSLNLQINWHMTGFWFLAYFAALFVLSRFVFIKKKAYRYALSGFFFGIYAVSVLLLNI